MGRVYITAHKVGNGYAMGYKARAYEEDEVLAICTKLISLQKNGWENIEVTCPLDSEIANTIIEAAQQMR